MLKRESLEKDFEMIKCGKISVSELARLLGCSRSWMSQIYNRYIRGEKLFLAKGSRSSIFSNKQKDQIIETFEDLSYIHSEVLYTPSMSVLKDIIKDTYPEFPDVSIETYRRIVRDSPDYLDGKRRISKYRKRFEAPHVGALLQGDVSTHPWIPDVDKSFPLLLFIDDKSRRILYARFVEHDNLEAHITALKEIFVTYGLPMAIYYDNDSKYSYIRYGGVKLDQRSDDPHLIIPKALEKMGVQLILSRPYQPQGKGKVERKFRTIQEQIPFYLKKSGAKTLADANKILENYVEKHNGTITRSTGKTPDAVFKSEDDVFVSLRKSDLETLENAFTRKIQRRVKKTNVISYQNREYLVPKFRNYSLQGQWIDVLENPNQWIKIIYKKQMLAKFLLEVEKC